MERAIKKLGDLLGLSGTESQQEVGNLGDEEVAGLLTVETELLKDLRRPTRIELGVTALITTRVMPRMEVMPLMVIWWKVT